MRSASQNALDMLALLNPEAILFDGCEDALVGWATQQHNDALAVYEYDRLVRVFRKQGMSHDDAIEWIGFNVEGLWAGPHTPLILYR